MRKSATVRFYPAVDGIQALDRVMVFARFWLNAADPFDEWVRKSVKCAEVLVLDKVDPRFVVGAYVANERALRAYQALNIPLPVVINHGMFF